MKSTTDSSGHVRPRRLSCAALCGCLLMTVVLVCLIRSTSNSVSTCKSRRLMFLLRNWVDASVKTWEIFLFAVSLRLFIETNVPFPAAVEEPNAERQGNRSVVLQLRYEGKQLKNEPITESTIDGSRVVCDFTSDRSDTCWMDGDIRVPGRSSTIMLAPPPTDQIPTENTTWKIKPYTRKWESTMEFIKELTVTTATDPQQAPRCTVNHSVPAVFFSTGGFVGNYFHDFTDVIVPLFMTVRRFDGEVQFVVTDLNNRFFDKYQPILRRLSHYPAIDMDTDDRVHCFPHAQVGLMSHKELGIDASRSPNRISMNDFREFLRTCFSLERRSSTGIDQQARIKPRLLLILRKGSRSFVNEREVIGMVEGLGFELIAAGPEETKNLSSFAQTVNSVDVLIGVHGAGLTNMVFLPTNATLIQIIPCCNLKVGCRYIFADPAPDMGIRYVEYVIAEEESSLIEQYPRDHAVFSDPLSILKQQGFYPFWDIFLNQQKVKIDVRRFRSVLSQVLQSHVKY
ncbi:hypothetical protein BHE74_00024211 [Ensete ventricosum]|nr:hypothetical protein GW17_00026727 [Ensete ventricosum]RWW68290.1 hypothetical protein BHE74_00024211 [Ensete ventricosum]